MGWDFDSPRALTHFHDTIIIQHLMDFSLFGKICRHLNKPVSDVTMVHYNDITTRGCHA